MHGSRRQRGFTIVELVIVILISSVLSLSLLQFISVPVDAFVDQSRRARLVAVADAALDRIAQDVHAALPNSLRVGCGGTCLEYLRTVGGGRYRAAPPGDFLSFVPADADGSFEVLGNLVLPGTVATSASADACRNGAAACLVIYNTGFAGTNAWQGDNIATLTAVGGSTLSFDNSVFSSGDNAFPAASPGQRFFVVDSPVSYLCDPVAGQVRRYEGYNIRALQGDVDSHAELLALSNPAESALLADGVTACSFSYSPGTPTRNAMLTVRLTVSEAGESINLLQQVGVLNGT
ncbi:MAG: prepilin-type N-terminal cleavage/methylation domain-containing protein [Gammaproteobacteria bacterium]|nr:prepilin-type N-terminal cleavage/methylation domain-containing protein [Gammaproteobacteria bacterium]